MVATSEGPQVRFNFCLRVSSERKEPNDERTIASQSFYRLVGIRLTGESLAQQCEEQSKRRRIEPTQFGQPGLTVGGQALSRRFSLSRLFCDAGREQAAL